MTGERKPLPRHSEPPERRVVDLIATASVLAVVGIVIGLALIEAAGRAAP